MTEIPYALIDSLLFEFCDCLVDGQIGLELGEIKPRLIMWLVEWCKTYPEEGN